jgi:type II secretory pathway component PulF
LFASIELLTEQFSGQLERILINVKDGLKGGEAFASTLENYPNVFSNIYVQLVRAGEATGKLDVILERLTTYLEKGEETRKRIKKAMSYPIMMLSFAGVVVLGMIGFVVPNIVSTFAQTGAELPVPTKILMMLSDFLSNYYLITGGIFIVIIGVFSYVRSTISGRLALDKLNLKLPFISYFSRTRAVVQFSKTLGMLLASGVHLSEALDIVSNIIDNMILTRAIKSARDKIIKEGKIAQYLKETNIFPPIAYYMIKTGEESGKLAEMLLYVGDEYDMQLTEIIDGLIAKINPIMMAVVGGIVFFIVLAMFLPMVRQGEALGI